MAELIMKHIELSCNRPAATKDLSKALKRQAKKGSIALEQYAKRDEQNQQRIKSQRSGSAVDSTENVVGDRVAVLGSTEQIYSEQNNGFFEAVLTAYNHHCNLRTSADDWWFCVIRRIALAIDDNAKKESVRKMFVNHTGKKELTVTVPEWPLSQVNYSSFFDKVAEQISQNVKVPEYVDIVTADFSTTTAVQRIVSQITLMSSLQEFFEYKASFECGIPAIEMLGTESDWQKLLTDLKTLKTILAPIKEDLSAWQPIKKVLGLTEQWWLLTEEIFTNLLETFRGAPDKMFWSHIITYNAPYGSGMGPSNPDLPPDYSGWIVKFLEGKNGLETCDFTSGLVTVPMNIVDGVQGVEDTAALVAGMAGFKVHDTTQNGRPSIQPFQGWALMLPPNSPLTV